MTKAWTLTQAKANFNAIVDRALRGEPQHVFRDGREEIIIVEATQYAASLRPRRSLVELFSALRGVDIDLAREETERAG